MADLIRKISRFPEELLDCKVEDVHDVLSGPTLIRLVGDSSLPPMLISTLLHGNEHSGFYALQRFIRQWLNQGTNHRTLLVFIGNTAAAAQNLRFLPNEPDFNRIWRRMDTPIAREATELFESFKDEQLFAAIDIHNNTGENPLYSCVSSLDPRHLGLANYFGEFIVYFTHPESSLSCSMAGICPSVTLECGKSSHPDAVESAYQYLMKVNALDELKLPDSNRHEVFQTIARIRLKSDVRYSFGDRFKDADDLIFNETIEALNFKLLDSEAVIGRYKKPGSILLDAMADKGVEGLLVERNGDIVIRERLVPSMLTKDKRVISQDCLGYLMIKKQ